MRRCCRSRLVDGLDQERAPIPVVTPAFSPSSPRRRGSISRRCTWPDVRRRAPASLRLTGWVASGPAGLNYRVSYPCHYRPIIRKVPVEMNGLEKFGIRSSDDIALNESADDLERDIRAVPGLADLLKDDCMSFHLGHAMINSIVRNLNSPKFLDLSSDAIGQMLANLRERSENCLFFMFIRGCYKDNISMEPDSFLQEAGWSILRGDDELIFYEAWLAAGKKWTA